MLQETFNNYKNAATQASVELTDSLLQDIQNGTRFPKLMGVKVPLKVKVIAAIFLFRYVRMLNQHILTDLSNRDEGSVVRDNRLARSEMKEVIKGINRFTTLGLNSSEDFLLDRILESLAFLGVTSANVTREDNTRYTVNIIISLTNPNDPEQQVTKSNDVDFTLVRSNSNGEGSVEISQGMILAGQTQISLSLTTNTSEGLDAFNVALLLTTGTVQVNISPDTILQYNVAPIVILSDIEIRIASASARRIENNRYSITGTISLRDSENANLERVLNSNGTATITYTNYNGNGTTFSQSIILASGLSDFEFTQEAIGITNLNSFFVGISISELPSDVSRVGSGSIARVLVPMVETDIITITPSLILVQRGGGTRVDVKMTLSRSVSEQVRLPFVLNNFFDAMENPQVGSVVVPVGSNIASVKTGRIETLYTGAYTIRGVFENPPEGFEFSTDQVTLDVPALNDTVRITRVHAIIRSGLNTYGLVVSYVLSRTFSVGTSERVEARISNADGAGLNRYITDPINANSTEQRIIILEAVIDSSVGARSFDIDVELITLPSGFSDATGGAITATIPSWGLAPTRTQAIKLDNIILLSRTETEYSIRLMFNVVSVDSETTLSPATEDINFSFDINNYLGDNTTTTVNTTIESGQATKALDLLYAVDNISQFTLSFLNYVFPIVNFAPAYTLATTSLSSYLVEMANYETDAIEIKPINPTEFTFESNRIFTVGIVNMAGDSVTEFQPTFLNGLYRYTRSVENTQEEFSINLQTIPTLRNDEIKIITNQLVDVRFTASETSAAVRILDLSECPINSTRSLDIGYENSVLIDVSNPNNAANALTHFLTSLATITPINNGIVRLSATDAARAEYATLITNATNAGWTIQS